ncbi:Protein canopy like protein 2 [Cyphomyrmex costatus]|uniref:Protein canopy like protein 2 n=2 Tax=Cyphomyrmex costatus TaxID=456900 RepID=A0A151I932_9HYME|nr:Protein canopy like protein 2 [Cyphomyrmex costatus]
MTGNLRLQMKALLLFLGLFCINVIVEPQEVDLKHLKCLVCRAAMNELETVVLNANPNKLVDVGNFRMDADGNTIRKKVPLGRSEIHISILLDNICEKLSDYVRATRKSDNQLIIFNLMSPSGGMNPIMSEVDIIQDGDLNKSLEHYCSAIVNEFEDDIVSLYVDGIYNKKKELCTKISNICNENYVDEEDDDYSDNEIDNDNYDSDFDMDRDEL